LSPALLAGVRVRPALHRILAVRTDWSQGTAVTEIVVDFIEKQRFVWLSEQDGERRDADFAREWKGDAAYRRGESREPEAE
jgi:hypothetical protein